MADGQKTYELVVQPRTILGKQSKQLRREHIIPAVVYGHKVEPQAVSVDQKELDRVYLRAGSNSVVDLVVGDGAKPQKVFIHNVQRDPVSHTLSHVDFMVVNLTEEITTTVSLTFVGESPLVKNGEAILLHPVDHLQIRALPMDIPQHIEVDISSLDEMGKSILVSDVEMPGNVHVLTSMDEPVAKLAELRAEEVVEEEAPEEEGEEAAEGEAEDAQASTDESSES